MWQGVKKTSEILDLWIRPFRQTDRPLPGDPYEPMHEEIILASGGCPLKSDKIGAMSTCPHREVHPKDKDKGYRGRQNFLCQTVWILHLNVID